MKIKFRAAGWILAGILTVGSIISPVTSVKASADWPKKISVSSKSAYLMEEDTGTVLYSKKANTKHYPASITKIMTALVAIENSDLDEKVSFSEEAVYNNEGDTSNIGRDVGEKMTMEECLYGMMLESANECAWAIAEHVGGTEKKFVKMMNEKAEELGCTNTHFNNPNGLPDEKHWTTAHDMALIAQAAFKNDTFARIVGTSTYTIPPTNKHKDPTYLRNHHNMLHYYTTGVYVYDGCLGGKTGYTTVANSTLVTYAKRDGMTLVCVVMDAQSPAHWIDTTNLFNWGFRKFEERKVSDFMDLSQSSVSDSIGKLSSNISLVNTDEDSFVVVPKNADSSDIQVSVESATSSDDENVIGKLSFSYENHNVGTATLLSSENSNDKYPFKNTSSGKNISGSGQADSSSVNYIKINLSRIMLIILTAAAAIIVIILLYRKLSWIIITRRRQKNSEKKGRQTFPTIKRRGSRRRRR